VSEVGAPLSRDARLLAYVASGIVFGGAYVAFDVLSESRLESGTLTGALASLHWIVDRASPVFVGAMMGVLFHYVSLRKELALAEEMATRAEALRTRLLKVERDQAVWVLVAAVLHELNNPLHALGLLLDEFAAEPDPVERDKLVERARLQADRARNHLDKLRAMKSLREPDAAYVAVDRVVLALADDVRSIAADGGVTVTTEIDAPAAASADGTYVRIILENLVDNSLCALRAGGGSAITMKLSRANGRVVVRVVDDAPSLDPEAERHLFEPFRSAKTQGLGLGLPIARALARAMRGELFYEEGRPKAFRLELPPADTEPARAAKADASWGVKPA
jgi:signal transduction histidine kinase